MAVTVRKKTHNSRTGAEELDSYYKEISRSPLLTRDQEVELARKVQNGCPQARATLAESNLRLVIKLARQYRFSNLPLADLIQEGNLGLLEAVDKFDPERQCRFSTYACWWIRQAITRAIANKGRAIRLPVHVNELLQKHRKLNSQTRAHTGQDLGLSEAASQLMPVDLQVAKRKAARKARTKNLTSDDPRVAKMVTRMKNQAEARLEEMLLMARKPISLELPIGEDSESTLCDILPGEEELPTPGLDRDALAWLLSHLSTEERLLLSMRFGFDDGEPKTFAELAKTFGVSRESLRQREIRIINKLQQIARQANWN